MLYKFVEPENKVPPLIVPPEIEVAVTAPNCDVPLAINPFIDGLAVKLIIGTFAVPPVVIFAPP